MPRKKTHEEYVAQVKEITEGEYTVASQYIQSATKVTMKHNTSECSHEWQIRPADFLRGSRCPICFGKTRLFKKVENEQTV